MAGQEEDRKGCQLQASELESVTLACAAEHKAKGQESRRANCDQISLTLDKFDARLMGASSQDEAPSPYGLVDLSLSLVIAHAVNPRRARPP